MLPLLPWSAVQRLIDFKMRDKYFMVIERSPTGFSAYSHDVLGCVATGATLDETLTNMQDALRLHIGAMVADGEEIPQPQGVQSYLEAITDSEGEEYYLTHIAVADVLPDSITA